MQIVPVLLAGGKGLRLAPLSSEARPKPFIPFDGLSLYQHSLRRGAGEGFSAPVIIGNAAHRFSLLNHARDARITPSAIVLEQTPAGTALAVALAAQHVQALHGDDAVMAIMPCDHFIESAAHWREAALRMARRVAREAAPCVGLMGIVPQTADANLGYFESDDDGDVVRFVEKPARPKQLLEHGGTWHANSGQFFTRPRDVRILILAHAPLLWREAERLYEQTLPEHEFLLTPTTHVNHYPSFDTLILEQAAHHCMVEPMPCAWADLGTREAWLAHTSASWEAQLALPIRTDRPWGYFYVRADEGTRVVKHLSVYPGMRLSLQRHQQRSEHWRVISGTARVTLEDTTTQLTTGNTVLIGRGWWHRLENAGSTLLHIEEIQEGLPNEADIERAEDDFGRAPISGRQHLA